ncbi:MAG: branched-chain amino acid ABC transporter ATP-binding protein/permease [Myxococcales bacterium]
MIARLRRLWPLLLLLPLLLPTLVASPYYVNGIVNRILIYTMLVASLDLMVGYVGDVSIGHAGFFAIGAYTVAILTARPEFNSDSTLAFFPQLPFVVALVPAVLLAAFAGFLLGFPALRSSGPYLAVITIAYGLIIYTMINEQEALTNGTKGITLAALSAGGVKLGGSHYFYVVYPSLVAVLYLVRNLTRSFWGRAFEALKYSAVAAECCGISRPYYKIWAFVLSAALGGLAGGFFAQLDSYVAPNTFAYNFSVEFLIALIFGGVRSILGNLLGAGVVVVLPDIFSRFNDYRLMVFGTLLLFVLFFLPAGLAGAVRRALRIGRRDGPRDRDALARASAGVEPLARPAGAGTAPAIELRQVTMMFGGLTAVNALSVALNPGRVLGLIGPNGSGKSTTVNLLTGIYFPTSGQVFSFGEDLTRMRANQRAERGIARTFQNLQLFGPLTALENVMVGLHLSFRSSLWQVLLGLPSVRREEAAARARAFALLRFVGLEQVAFETASNLSYGQARHLEIARALALQPRLLLLDEPAAGLTSAEIEGINTLVRKIKEAGISVLLIEHHMDMVMAISDEVTVLDFGKKIAEGSPQAIQANPTVVEAYLGKHVTSQVAAP